MVLRRRPWARGKAPVPRLLHWAESKLENHEGPHDKAHIIHTRTWLLFPERWRVDALDGHWLLQGIRAFGRLDGIRMSLWVLAFCGGRVQQTSQHPRGSRRSTSCDIQDLRRDARPVVDVEHSCCLLWILSTWCARALSRRLLCVYPGLQAYTRAFPCLLHLARLPAMSPGLAASQHCEQVSPKVLWAQCPHW